MNYKVFMYASLLGLALFCQSSFANPTNGYCQTVDGSVCGMGGGGSYTQYWYAAVVYDPDTAAWSVYTATSRDLAMISAAKECKKNNTTNPDALFMKQKICRKKVVSAHGYIADTIPLVVTKGQLADGKYQFNLRYGKYGQRTFFPSNTFSEANIKDVAMNECSNKYKLTNCSIIHHQYTSYILQ